MSNELDIQNRMDETYSIIRNRVIIAQKQVYAAVNSSMVE